MGDNVVQLLKVHDYFRGVREELLQQIAGEAQIVQHAAGAVIHEPNVVPTTVNFVLRGRLKMVRVDAQGSESFFRMVERGDQFGMMAGALAEPVPVRVITLEPTFLLTLDYERAMELLVIEPELRRMWMKSYAGSLRHQFFGVVPKRALVALALVHESPATAPASQWLIERLHGIGEQLGILSDSEQSRLPPGVRFRSLQVDGGTLETEEIRNQVAEWQDVDRIIFDVHAARASEWMSQLLAFVDRAIYFVPATAGDAAIRRLQAFDVAGRGWSEKTSIVWILQNDCPVAPVVPNLGDYACRDFKISLGSPTWPQGKTPANGLERLVHDLRGVRIGVALGGGAARGMAHLGVLKALEQHGIVVDMIAGTSSGAMTGAVYASGLDADYAANQFSTDLRPSWIFRRLPRGGHWYLLHKFRRGHFDPMLRKYLHDWKLEQLPLPCVSVTVDLVSGKAVIRRQGDVVHAVLESINLPVLSVPIGRNGQALIDGGLVNNIPADVLVSMGCNFVIAVSVTAKIERVFCNLTPEAPTWPGRRPGVIQTLLRSLLIQNHNLNALGVQPAEVVIEPDVTTFDLTEFVRAKEAATIGEATALDQIPKIQQLLARLDPKLFARFGG